MSWKSALKRKLVFMVPRPPTSVLSDCGHMAIISPSPSFGLFPVKFLCFVSLGGLPTLASKIPNEEIGISETVLHWLFFCRLFFADSSTWSYSFFLWGSASSARDMEVTEHWIDGEIPRVLKPNSQRRNLSQKLQLVVVCTFFTGENFLAH